MGEIIRAVTDEGTAKISVITARDAVYGINERDGTIFRLENGAFVRDTAIDPERSGIADAFRRI